MSPKTNTEVLLYSKAITGKKNIQFNVSSPTGLVENPYPRVICSRLRLLSESLASDYRQVLLHTFPMDRVFKSKSLTANYYSTFIFVLTSYHEFIIQGKKKTNNVFRHFIKFYTFYRMGRSTKGLEKPI